MLICKNQILNSEPFRSATLWERFRFFLSFEGNEKRRLYFSISDQFQDQKPLLFEQYDEKAFFFILYSLLKYICYAIKE